MVRRRSIRERNLRRWSILTSTFDCLNDPNFDHQANLRWLREAFGEVGSIVSIDLFVRRATTRVPPEYREAFVLALFAHFLHSVIDPLP